MLYFLLLLMIMILLSLPISISLPCLKSRPISSPILSSTSLSLALLLINDDITTIDNFEMIRRIDDKKRLVHFEFYRKSWYLPLLKRLPLLIRPKPLLKGGMRTFISTSNEMDEIIGNVFNNTLNNNDNVSLSSNGVALMVYMWVSPKFRGKNYGNCLLSYIIYEARKKLKAQYLLIVHDDNGSGKLIKFYEDRGFQCISDKMDKCMLLKL